MSAKFELNRRYSLTTEKGAITPEGKRLIAAFLASANLLNPEWVELNHGNGYIKLNPLPDVDEFAWFWLVQRGEFRGTFPKRVSQWYKKTQGLNCPKGFLQELGNLARSHSLDAYAYTFDFTDKFDWTAGDFGDSGSCYWSSNEAARELLARHGGLAIRFYEGEVGYGRAWVYRVDDTFIVFNGYGLTTLEAAKILAAWLGMDYRKIKLYNNRESGGLLYINGSGTGYVVGEPDDIEDFYEYDFEIYTPNACERCGRDMGEYSHTTPNGEEYCDDCFYEYYEICYECDRAVNRDNTTYIERLGRDVCDDCLRENYAYCDYCGEYSRDYEVEDDKHGLAKCRGCREKD